MVDETVEAEGKLDLERLKKCKSDDCIMRCILGIGARVRDTLEDPRDWNRRDKPEKKEGAEPAG
jgi:hypothetical protein